MSNRCVNTFKKAHNGEAVTSVRFSKNSKYVLSSGKDGNAALWELSTGSSFFIIIVALFFKSGLANFKLVW